jgi:PAS domain S-box-containing protein
MERQDNVLVVDDDEFALQSIANLLESETYQVVTATSGSEALDLLEQGSFDLVLTDLKMPGVDGIEVLKQTREIAPKAVVMILTGYASLESAIEALREGAHDYLVKPCSAEELKLKIERGLRTVRLAEQRRRAEEALQESKEFSSNLLSNAPHPTIVINPDTSVRYGNPAFERLTGFSTAELVGRKAPYPWWTEETLEKTSGEFEEAMRKGALKLEEFFQKKNGERFWVDITSTPVSSEGEFKYYLANWVDITERKRAEEELRRSCEKLQKALEGTVHTLVTTIELRDPYTAGHQRRVAQLACAITEEMGLSEEQIEGIRMAALIHDMGKITVPAEILSKPGQLSDIEYGLIKMHPKIGYDVLKEMDFPWPLAQIVLQHHERLDGSGYPQGLSGEKIMLEARILAVADVVEAMASHRPYRPPRGLDKALEEVSQNRDVLYDAEVVDICLKLFTEKGFEFG